MKPNQLPALPKLLREKKEVLIAHWLASLQQLPGAADLKGPALRDHIPQFIDEMIGAIARRDAEVREGGPGSPVDHGLERLNAGFDIKEVVIEYNILRDAVHHVVEQADLILSAADWSVVHHIIDDAIAWAVDAFAKEKSAEIQRRRDEHLAFIAHDLRTPLNAISLITDLLACDFGENVEASDSLLTLKRNVERIGELIGRATEHEPDASCSEVMQPVLRELDLWPLVHRLLQEMRPVAESAGVRLINEVPRHLTTTGDASLLARALQNLIGNAIKFAAKGEVLLGAKKVENGVECWVRDNGAGIEADRISQIFDKGVTDEDESLAGSGLGLAIVKQVVEAHGGVITVESKPGHGTAFHFVIPPQPKP